MCDVFFWPGFFDSLSNGASFILEVWHQDILKHMEMIEMLNQSTLMINGSRNILADFHPNKCMAAIAIPIIGNEEFNTADLANEDWS